ncbi:Tigger transposable element-derived protein 4 [Ceratobasidium theobromae]|uniref:Tigger transposable element-derived protein 4 n=1 Tax=Ceratobasidium theobromae TaxID=1582974 RepID=A0A5N5QBU9_9AGAM|nr:Tigger transposable element-derived protein 4 [Ceratobasidium theobromae]
MRLALERDNAGIDKIYNITQLQAMNLASAAWECVTPTTITNCWRHTRLAPPILESSGGTHATLEEDEGAAQEAEELTAEVLRHPNLLEPEFLQMMAMLSLTYPTAPELTDGEIVGQVVLSANIV